MLLLGDTYYWTRRLLGQHIYALGIRPGDAVMVHAGMRSVGPLVNGPDTLIGALLDVLGPDGTLLCYVNWDQPYEDAFDEQGRLPDSLKPDISPFDPARSRASRDHGAFAEFVRTTPDAKRSQNPGASVVAIGRQANWFTANHSLDYGYGAASPFAKLTSAAGQVLVIGAPLDTISLLHHAEHLAQLPGKHVRRMEVPLLLNGQVVWRMIEEFDTVDPVVDGLADDYFGTIADDFLATGQGQRGLIGQAPATLFPAAELVDFAVRWLEERYG